MPFLTSYVLTNIEGFQIKFYLKDLQKYQKLNFWVSKSIYWNKTSYNSSFESF